MTLALLGDAIATCRQRGWFVVVLCADCSEAGAAPLAKLCLERTVPFVRMPSKSESPGLYYVVDGHWTAAGHRRAAELLVPLLRK